MIDMQVGFRQKPNFGAMLFGQKGVESCKI
jgi:hypothetical protein